MATRIFDKLADPRSDRIPYHVLFFVIVQRERLTSEG